MRQLAAMAIAVSICASAVAQQKTVEMGWTGENGYVEHQTPSPERPFSFYISDQRQQQFLQSESDSCIDTSACKDVTVKVTQQELGSSFGKRIVQIVYALSGGGPARNQPAESQPFWKSIVIESSRGMFREQLLLKNEEGFWTAPPAAAHIVNAGAATVLVTNDSTSSREMSCTGEIWVLGESGAALADFSEIDAAIRKAAPRGTQNVTPMCAAIDSQALEVHADIQQLNTECSACGLEGHVVVKFRFEGPRAIPISTNFSPAVP